MKLSNRLETLFDLIPDGCRLVDVGTDHGLLVVKAILEGKAEYAYALDIASGPLEQARQNVNKYEINDKVSLELRDGLQGFEGEANCYVLAGMGEETIWMILEDYDFNDSDIIIIQANTKLPWLRESLAEGGFEIIDERYLLDRNIPTFMMKIIKSQDTIELSNYDKWIGPILKDSQDEDYLSYLNNRYRHLKEIKHYDDILLEEYNVIQEIIF